MRASDSVAPPRRGPPVSTDAARCTGCRVCELRCSLRFEKAFNPAGAAIAIRRLVHSSTEYAISFDERCDNCGICVRYCAYGALSQAKKVSSAA